MALALVAGVEVECITRWVGVVRVSECSPCALNFSLGSSPPSSAAA